MVLERPVTIALAQLDPVHDDIDKALDLVEVVCEQVAYSCPELLVLPEYFLTDSPVLYDDPVKMVRNLRYDVLLTELSRFAKRFGLSLIPGTLPECVNGDIFNSAPYFDRKGSLRSIYRKINVSPIEATLITPGEDNIVVHEEWGSIGMNICMDLMDPFLANDLARDGADIIACPSYWPDSMDPTARRYCEDYSRRIVNNTVSIRARDNGIFYAFCNMGGLADFAGSKIPLLGYTQVGSPFMKPIARVEGNEDTLCFAMLDPEVLDDADKVFKYDYRSPDN